jgi:hypothetical protein
MKKILLVVTMFVFGFLFVSCSESEGKTDSVIEYLANGQDTSVSVKGVQLMNLGTVVADSAMQNNKFSQIDSIFQYGMGLNYNLPDSIIGKELSITIKAKALETEAVNSVIVISLIDPANNTTYYNAIDLRGKISQVNQWSEVTGTCEIDAVSNDFNGARLTIYPYKSIGKGKLKIDDLSVSIKALTSIDDEE